MKILICILALGIFLGGCTKHTSEKTYAKKTTITTTKK